MNFIFMLTQGDRTVPNCLEVLQDVLSLGLRHIGFKDIGVGQEEMQALTDRIKSAGAVSYLEVVSEDPESALRSARVARGLGVDRLLGGTEVVATLDILDGSAIGYYPFPGIPFDHPTKLGGDPGKIAKDCSSFMTQGAAGADLLAYRATDADPLDLVTAARGALANGELIVAGSIDSPEQIAALAAAGVDGFTIGSAIFDDAFAPDRPGIIRQVESVLACLG